MNKNLIIFLCLVLINSAFGAIQTNSFKLQDSKLGTVTIYKDHVKGFHIFADFKYDYPTGVPNFGNYTYPMHLGLYTSTTLLPKNCLAFNTYDCSQWSCSTSSSEFALDYLYFTASGLASFTQVYIDYSKWILQFYTWALSPNTCLSNQTNYDGASVNGIIGLGVNSKNRFNFINETIFSIYLNKNLSGGQLLFREDLNYAASTTPIAVFLANSNWEIGHWEKKTWQGFNELQVVGSKKVYSTEIFSKVIFDLNADAIGFPSNQYAYLIKTLQVHGVLCVGAGLYRPTCLYAGEISDLPTITIVNGTNANTIQIPPEIYVQNTSSSSNVQKITLNLRALGNDLTGYNYVSSSYKDYYIILDANFMRYYYTVFDAREYGGLYPVRIYKAGNPPAADHVQQSHANVQL